MSWRDFLTGYGSILNLFPVDEPPRLPTTYTTAEAWRRDAEKIRGDWRKVIAEPQPDAIEKRGSK